jgi:hypothetical protein
MSKNENETSSSYIRQLLYDDSVEDTNFTRSMSMCSTPRYQSTSNYCKMTGNIGYAITQLSVPMMSTSCLSIPHASSSAEDMKALGVNSHEDTTPQKAGNSCLKECGVSDKAAAASDVAIVGSTEMIDVFTLL